MYGRIALNQISRVNIAEIDMPRMFAGQKLLRLFLLTICLGCIGASMVAPSIAHSEEIPINKNWRSIAIKGYDPVAYFTMDKAVKGRSKFESKWQDARWRFTSQQHQELFESDPDKYAPRFGGFCAGGIALGQKAPIDPEAWIIVEGKLYLNYDKKGRDDIAATPDEILEQAEKNWEVLGKKD